MNRIGMATIGQSPRDDLVPHMQRLFSKPVDVLQMGALDTLSRQDIAAFAPDRGEMPIVTLLRDGSEVSLSHGKILPRMQSIVDAMNAQGCNFIVMLCGADWSSIRSQSLIVNPGQLFPSIIAALAKGRRLGIIKPSPGQVEAEKKRYAALGIAATVTAASPYTGEMRLSSVRDAARLLAGQNVDLVWMTCVGMDDAMRRVVEEETGKPVILARSILARVVDELLPG